MIVSQLHSQINDTQLVEWHQIRLAAQAGATSTNLVRMTAVDKKLVLLYRGRNPFNTFSINIIFIPEGFKAF